MSWLDYADRDGGEFAYITHGSTVISNSLIKQGGLSVDRYTASGSFLEFGNVSASELSLTLDNSEEWFDWEKGDVITVEIDRERQSESTPTADNYKVGTFIVDSVTKSLNTVNVVALDSMVLLDVPFDWEVQTYDITTVLGRVATLCGITFTQDISGLANYDIEVPQYQCTCRTLVSNIAEVMGSCAYFNGNNELTFGWYEAGTITDFTEAVRVSSNVSENSYKVVNIAIGTSQDPRVELVKNGNEWDVTMRLLMSNPIVARHGNSLLTDIIAKCYIINTSLHGMDAVALPYPSVEPFQVFAYIDTTKSLNYLVPITNRTYSLNRNMAIKSVFNPENLTISNAFTNAGRAIVEEIEETVEETKKHFFFITDSGAHITEIANDYMNGNNVLIDSDSVDIRDGTTVMASFGGTTQIGELGGSHSIFDAGGQRFYAGNGTTILANIGYGEGASETGTAIAPYFTFGTRKYNSAVGNYSFGTGKNVTASGDSSHAEGASTTASGHNSHAESLGTTASGYTSHAEGLFTTASGSSSHAEGVYTTASGDYSHAEGYRTTASGSTSHAQNMYTVASGSSQTALGKFNVADTTSAVIIGNGRNDDNRSNALTIDWSGNIEASGNIKTQNGSFFVGNDEVYHEGNLDLASSTKDGLMSSSDKEKLDEFNILAGITQVAFGDQNSNTGAVHIWGNSAYKVATRVRNNVDNKAFDFIARSDYLTLYNSTDSQTVWKISPDEYQAGESITFTSNQINICQGFVTNSTKSLDFQIPLPRSAKGRTCTLSLNASNGLSVRTGQGGYLEGTQYIDTTTSEYTVTCTPNDLGVWVRITKSSAYTGVTNNMACAVVIAGTLTFS